MHETKLRYFCVLIKSPVLIKTPTLLFNGSLDQWNTKKQTVWVSLHQNHNNCFGWLSHAESVEI